MVAVFDTVFHRSIPDRDRHQTTLDCEGRISTDDSRLHAYVIPVELY